MRSLDDGDGLLRYREEFPGLDGVVHLISHSLGAMPRGVRQRLREFADAWEGRSVRAWEEGWWQMAASTGDKVAAILGADRGTVVMQPSVSIAQAIVCSCFDFTGPRNKVVYSDLNFPSVTYVYEAQRARGARIQMVSSEGGTTVPTERILEAIDEETLLVPVSHVLYKSSYVQDAGAITEKAHRVGARVVLDVYQSIGTLPLRVGELGVDFAVGGAMKWLCGGSGAAFLYVRPDLAGELQPRVTGWMAHAEPFAFRPGPIRYADPPYRFLHGSPPVACFYAAEPGCDLILEIGTDRIRAKSLRQTERLASLLDQIGLAVRSPREPDRRGGTVVVDVPDGARVARELVRRDVLVDHRPGAGIRVSPHYYTRDDELEQVVGQISEIVGTRPWERTC